MNYLNRVYGKRVADYRESASREFRNMIGDDYKNANGSVSYKDPNDRTYTMRIALNTTTAAGAVRLFGYSQDPGGLDAYNTTNNTTVTVVESSHAEAKVNVAMRPQRIQGVKVKITTGSASQFDNAFSLVYKSPNGSQITKLWQPTNYEDPQNYNSLIVVDPMFQIPLDAFTAIQFTVNAATALTVIFWIKEEVEVGKVLNNKSVLSVSEQGIPIGKTPVILETRESYANAYGRRKY